MPVPYIPVGVVQEALKVPDNKLEVLNETLLRSCAFIDTFCNRSPNGFAVQDYDWLMNGTGTEIMYLPELPVVSIQRIATINQPVMTIHNTDGDTGARALVKVDRTGIHLTYVKNAVTTTDDILFATYPTVQACVDQINTVGHHWTASVMGVQGGWSSADIRPTQGNFGARIVTAYLWAHTYDLQQYRVKEDTGEVYYAGGWSRGWGNFRVQATCGYEFFPPDLAQALIEICQINYLRGFRNPLLGSETIGQYSYSTRPNQAASIYGESTVRTLHYYKIRSVKQFSAY